MNMTEEDMSTEDVAEHADDKVDALIKLLVKKGVITEEEYEREFEDLFED
jgi:polyhydroxyalkanoate synthesis regulator phasin